MTTMCSVISGGLLSPAGMSLMPADSTATSTASITGKPSEVNSPPISYHSSPLRDETDMDLDDQGEPLDFTSSQKKSLGLLERRRSLYNFCQNQMLTEPARVKRKSAGSHVIHGFSINDILSHKTGGAAVGEPVLNIVRPWDRKKSSAVAMIKPQKEEEDKDNSPLDALFQMATKTFDGHKTRTNLEHAQLSFSTKQTSKKKRKSRTAFTNHQIFELEKRFLYQKYLSPADRDEIASHLGLTNAQVITWFQNRRAKLKRDMEELRKDVEITTNGVILSTANHHHHLVQQQQLPTNHHSRVVAAATAAATAAAAVIASRNISAAAKLSMNLPNPVFPLLSPNVSPATMSRQAISVSQGYELISRRGCPQLSSTPPQVDSEDDEQFSEPNSPQIHVTDSDG